MTVVKHRTYVCARCGLRAVSYRLMFSRFTRSHYCMDIDACQRRARKANR